MVGGIYMSHPVNDEILERLYEEVKEEFDLCRAKILTRKNLQGGNN